MPRDCGYRSAIQLHNVSFHVLGWTLAAEHELGRVTLWHPLDVLNQTGRLPNAKNQHARRERIERPGMPHPLTSDQRLDAVDDAT